MKSALWLTVGVVLGFVAAQQVTRSPQAQSIVDDLGSRVREFTDAVVDGYKTRDAELRSNH